MNRGKWRNCGLQLLVYHFFKKYCKAVSAEMYLTHLQYISAVPQNGVCANIPVSKQ